MKLARNFWLFILVLGAAIAIQGTLATAQQQLNGQVLLAGQQIASATVTLWRANADAPAQLGQAQTGADGRFAINVPPAIGDNATVYLVAKGGTLRGATNQASSNTLLLLLGAPLPSTVTVNELTTVASAFVGAQFIKGEAISGNPLGLRIAAECSTRMLVESDDQRQVGVMGAQCPCSGGQRQSAGRATVAHGDDLHALEIVIDQET